MQKFTIALTLAVVFVISPAQIFAQRTTISPSPSAVPVKVEESLIGEATTAADPKKIEEIQKEDITRPEETAEKEEILKVFEKRLVKTPNLINFMAYTVQYAVRVGVPANTIMLILLLPFLATLVAFVRYIIGLPTLEMLVPVALAVTLIATGLTAGFIILLAIIIASMISRLLLKKVRILQMPKKALSILVVSTFVFLALMGSAIANLLVVKQLSIFPILIFILLSDKIVSLQLKKNFSETIAITAVTIGLGILGFLFLSLPEARTTILLYPELILLLIPVNFLIGRYLGLRFTEIFRFTSVKNAN